MPNPYIVGPPLRNPKGFFGRRKIIKWITQKLSNINTNAIVIVGQRRIGKTSLLHQIKHALPNDKYHAVYFDLQDQAERSLGQVLADIADTLSEEIQLGSFPVNEFDNRGRFFERDFLPSLFKALGQNIRPVLLLDEFDVLDRLAEERLPETAAAKEFFRFLRHLMHKEPRLAFVFVLGRHVDDLTIDYTNTFKTSLEREIWVLDHEATEALIRQGEDDKTLRFSQGSIDRIIELTSGHPYLTQLLCQLLWDASHDGFRLITPEIVDLIVPVALQEGNQALIWLWNGLGPAEKIYAAALAEISDEMAIIPEQSVRNILAEHAGRLRSREVEMAPPDLVKRRVLVADGERKYRFAVELFRQWVKEKRPLRDVKDEMDRVDEIAEGYFNIGFRLFKDREWLKAVEEFQRALERNVRHFKARRFLGEALLELGQIDEAVTELELALELDQVEARLPLIRALTLKGQNERKMGNEDIALNYFDRVLELSPQEIKAKEERQKIWIARGDRAAEYHDYSAALEAYKQAGANDKVAEMEVIRTGQMIQNQAETAQELMNEENWGKAAEIYQYLTDIDPKEKRWKQSLTQAKEELWLEERYAEGIGFIFQEDLDQAVDVFIKIINVRPFYKDVTEQLNKISDSQPALKTDARTRGNYPLRQNSWIPLVAMGGIGIILVFVIGIWAGVTMIQNQFPTLTIAPTLFTPTHQPEIASPIATNNEQGLQPDGFTILDLESSIDDSSRSALIEPVVNLGLEIGDVELKGIPFGHYWEIGTETRHAPDRPESITLRVEEGSIQRVFFLIQADWGLSTYSGEQVGTIELIFSQGEDANFIIEEPLILGNNIRDWARDGLNAVSTIDAENVFEAWSGYSSEEERPGGIDLLIMEVPPELSNQELISIRFIDTSSLETDSIDTGIHILGISLGHTSDAYPFLWDVRDVQINNIATLVGHQDNVNDLAWSPGNELLASTSLDGSIIIWDLEADSIQNQLHLSSQNIFSVSWNTIENLLAVGAFGGVAFWDMANEGVVYSIADPSWASSTSWSPNQEILAYGTGNGEVVIWDWQNKSEMIRLPGDESNDVNNVIWSPNGELLAADSNYGTVTIWDPFSGQIINSLEGHTDDINAISWSPDGKYIASGGRDNNVIIWNVESGEIVHVFGDHLDWIHSVSWHPNSLLLVSGSRDNNLIIWDVESGIPIHILNGHTDWIHGVSWSSDGLTIASGSVDRTIKLWSYKP